MSTIAKTPADAVRLFFEGITEHDIDKAMSYYEPDAVFVHPADGSVFRGEDEVREALLGLIELKPTLRVKDFRKEVVLDDIAFISTDHELTGKTPDGESVVMQGTSTDVVQYTEGQGWKFIIDNPAGLAEFD